MADRPTHALTVRPAVVEAPLWLLWRTAYAASAALAASGDMAARYLDAYRDSDPAQRHLAALVAATTSLVMVLATVLITLLT
ncbi:hypothetical protein [Amycolatopsis lurida]|uniref:hypothetical protein n=1 Tax=Amycolatopsis lurida TaxID=31959 RepID=UPI00365D73B0